MNGDDILNIFFVECDELIEAAEAGLAAFRAESSDPETINGVFRAIHSIKGGAGAFGFAPLQSFAHCFETLLADVREGTVEIDDPLVDLLLRALDLLSDHVSATRTGEQSPDDACLIAELTEAQADCQGSNLTPKIANPAPLHTASGCATIDIDKSEADFDLDALLDELAADGPKIGEHTLPWQIHIRPHEGAMAKGGEPLLLLRELADLGGQCVTCDLTGLPELDGFDPHHGYLGWSFSMPGNVPQDRVTEVFDFIGDDCSLAIGDAEAIPAMRACRSAADVMIALNGQDSQGPNSGTLGHLEMAPPVKPAVAGGQSIRVDLAKLDKLIDGVGELVIAQAMLAQRLAVESLANVEELAMLETLVRDIQENALAFRAQPIGTVFARLPRLLRELTMATGKQVKLEISGEATELDKTVIERLSEPLTHLVRNAVDHGIEKSEERLAVGKPAEGTLHLAAEHRAGQIVIRISDDGRGIDREKVLAKAVAQGLVAADAALSDEEIDNLIFIPGFSTAEQLSSISGRGVGMDVVRQNVKELGGRVTIKSRPGLGATLILTMPLTLAISDGMIVQVGEQTLVVPLAHVVESLRPVPADIKGLGVGSQMLYTRGRFIPIIPLGTALGANGATSDPCSGVLIIVETERVGRAALLVDAITDQRQFVIKNLDKHYCAVQGVAGATILGDGRVALILDIDQLSAATTTTAAGHRKKAA